jgi:uroporphyrinogen decarboxylase
VQGNLAPEWLLQGGDAMLDGARAICESLSQGAFVFNLGHGVIKETPPENVAALVDFVHGFKTEALAA